MLAVIGIPALDACRGDSRGLLGCLRGAVNDKFDPATEPAAPPVAPTNPAPEISDPAPSADLPSTEGVISAEPPTPTVVATADLDPEVAEPPVNSPASTRSISPPAPEKPSAPASAPPLPVDETSPSPAAEPVGEADDSTEPPAETGAAAVSTTEEFTEEIVDVAEPPPAEAPPPDLPEPAPASEVVVLPVSPTMEATSEAPARVASAPDWAVPPESPPPSEFDPPTQAVQPADPTAKSDEPPADVTETGPPPSEPEPSPVIAVEKPLPISDDPAVAVIDPVVPDGAPAQQPPLVAPSIAAVEIDGGGSFIAGSGPDGATMRLYVDGLPVGVSPVEGGRWLVEGTDLLTGPSHTLRVEALDPLSGKQLGEAVVEFERRIAPETTLPNQPATAEPLAEAPQLPTVPAPAHLDDLVVSPEAAIATDPPVVTEDEMEIPPPEPQVPSIPPVLPANESASVTILSPGGPSSITSLPATDGTSSDSVETLITTPKPPAVIAHFNVSEAHRPANVTVLKVVPIGDPGAGRFVSGKAIIRRGDTLWDIAHRFYGRGIHYRTIFRANRNLIARPSKIYPGQVFDMPLVYDD